VQKKTKLRAGQALAQQHLLPLLAMKGKCSFRQARDIARSGGPPIRVLGHSIFVVLVQRIRCQPVGLVLGAALKRFVLGQGGACRAIHWVPETVAAKTVGSNPSLRPTTDSKKLPLAEEIVRQKKKLLLQTRVINKQTMRC
jgi:hypothetical protein